MTKPTIPPMRARRFDIKDLGPDWAALGYQIRKGPTYLRQNGQIAFVMIEHELFRKLHPRREVWSTDEMPEWAWSLLNRAMQDFIDADEDD